MRIALALSLLLLSPLAGAAEAAKSQAAVEVARLSLPRETWDQVIAATQGQVAQMGEQSLAQSGLTGAELEDGRTALRSVVKEMAGLIPSYEEMLDLQAGLLVKHWSDPELRELAAFYRSPIGQKNTRIMPAVMQDVMGWMQARVQQRMPALMEKMQAEVMALESRRGKKK